MRTGKVHLTRVDIAVSLCHTEGVSPTWEELVDVARWAPSAHNIQPWRIRPRADGEADLLCASNRLLPATDPTGRFTMVGLGIFLELLAVAARAEGVDVEADLTLAPLVAGNGALHDVARLRLVAFSGREELEPRLIRERRTSRVPYDGRPVADGVLGELAAAAAAWGHTATFSSDGDLVRFVLDLNRETLFYDLTDDAAREEVGRWLRFSARRAETTGDGFSPAALGFPGALLYAFFHGRRLLGLPGIKHATDALYMRTMRGTRTVGWVQGAFEQPDEWVRAGRMLARLWLTMTRHGVHLHPFGSIITNRDANTRVRERIPHDAERGTLWLILRLGYSVQPPRSHRLPTDELLVR